MSDTRVYPQCCTSAFCGGFNKDCEDCPNKATLDVFKAWREAHTAVRKDPVWCPSIWTATS